MLSVLGIQPLALQLHDVLVELLDVPAVGGEHRLEQRVVAYLCVQDVDVPVETGDQLFLDCQLLCEELGLLLTLLCLFLRNEQLLTA